MSFCNRPTSVLKFGSSVLDGPEGFRRAAREIDSEVRRGRSVVAVVSAMPGATDTLLQLAGEVADPPPPHHVSALAATGEYASVALLCIALAPLGIAAHRLSAGTAGLRTAGPLLDAHPTDVDTRSIVDALTLHRVAIIPGFLGVDPSGETSLLGRGGSDLTALFLAHRLGAVECRLVKDVDGVYSADPNVPGGPAVPYASVSWDRVLEVAGQLVQPKAVRFARTLGLPFRVAAPGGTGTWVGAVEEAVA
ncbi:MAG: hypothetical protein OEZ37_12595 [Gemmatimonadota bacterium]|nr:hypothetical protein [Gemmatimonadota bacterium]